MKLSISLILMLAAMILSGCRGNNTDQRYTSVVEGTAIQVPAMTGGKILQILVDTGQEVQPNQLLAVIDTLELTFQRRQLQAALEELAAHFQITQTQLQQAQTNESYVREKQQRIARLFKTNSASRQQLDDLTHQLQQSRTALKTARQNFRSIEARRKQVQAQLASLEKKIKDAQIYAPLGGIVSEKYFEPGEAIAPMSPLVEIIDLRKVDVKIYVSETKLPEVKYGQEVKIRVDGLERDLAGRVSWVSPKAEFTPKSILTPETRTSLVYAVKINIDNPEGILKHGMPVEVLLD